MALPVLTLLPTLQEARCIFAIHNLSHQGVEPAATFSNLGLPDDWCADLPGGCDWIWWVGAGGRAL